MTVTNIDSLARRCSFASKIHGLYCLRGSNRSHAAPVAKKIVRLRIASNIRGRYSQLCSSWGFVMHEQ
jgi:hypothetical protein